MSGWEDDGDWEDILDSAEDLDEDEAAALEEFIEEVYEIGDLIGSEGFDGPTVEMIITTSDGEVYEVTIPAEFIPDIIEFADELDIEFEIDS